jgi:hypothetical protein
MTYSGIFEETECMEELKRAKKFIEKQSGIILALEMDIEVKDNEIQKLKQMLKKK